MHRLLTRGVLLYPPLYVLGPPSLPLSRQSMHCLLTRGGLGRFAGRLETLAGLLAAVMHDYEHRGLNNDFLIKSQARGISKYFCTCFFLFPALPPPPRVSRYARGPAHAHRVSGPGPP